MKRRIVSALAAAAMLFAGTGCSVSLFSAGTDSAPTRHFVLSSEPAAGETLPAVAFTRVVLPAYLDVPQVVVRDGNELARSEKNRWGEPLSRGVARELSLSCALALAEKGFAAAELPQVRVFLERFDGTLGGNVEIAAFYALLPKRAAGAPVPAETRRAFRASVPVAAPNDYAAYVSALDEALKLLAADIAGTLAETPAAPAAPVPAKES